MHVVPGQIDIEWSLIRLPLEEVNGVVAVEKGRVGSVRAYIGWSSTDDVTSVVGEVKEGVALAGFLVGEVLLRLYVYLSARSVREKCVVWEWCNEKRCKQARLSTPLTPE
jgi:hypothetical protein